MRIIRISAYQVYDSRGNPTVEAEIELANGARGRGTVPSGASTGQFEALELRDNDPTRFQGRSVFAAIKNIETILGPELIGREDVEQRVLDELMIALDGTPSKSKLGANSILAVSMAFANAAAASRGVALHESLGDGVLLPLPEIQMIGGGAHANWRIDVQDFMIVVLCAKNYEDVMEIAHNCFHATKSLLRGRGKLRGAADEGGFWPEVDSNEEAFEVVLAGIQHAGYVPGQDVGLSLDIAASDLFDEHTGKYSFRSENRSFDREEFALCLLSWCQEYPIVSIEDPMADSDWEGWRLFRSTAPPGLQIIGDDLFTTNLDRIRMGIADNSSNAVLIKLNQIGTVSETMDAIALTKSAGWNAVVSARSGETEDTFIAHLAVATEAGQLKVGSFSRSERMAKWNEVIRIGRNLGQRATFAGASILTGRVR